MTFLHSGDLGDIIYALPVMKHLGGGRLFLTSRPGTREPMTSTRFEFIKPLLLDQSYIRDVQMHKGEKITHDFTGFRDGHRPEVTLAELQRRHVDPIGSIPKFDTPWIERPCPPNGPVVIHRSARYHNPEWKDVWPHIMASEPEKLFVGTRQEHAEFQAEFGEIDYLPVSSAREMAGIIADGRHFYGNQSLPFAIAEGMKVDRTLEVCPTAKDCLYTGGNVTHVLKASQLPGAATPRLMLALQFCPHDMEAARELVNLIVEIEPEFRHDVEFTLAARDDVQWQDIRPLERTLQQKFRVHALKSRRSGRGWPEGCNDLWQETMTTLGVLERSGGTSCEAVFTFEPDCIPARKDWIDALIHEWKATVRCGKFAFGNIAPAIGGGPDGVHMNGNMCLSIKAMKRFPRLQTSMGSWDMHHRRVFLEHGVDTGLIVNLYNERRELSRDQVLAIHRTTVRPAIIHGIKNASGRRAIESALREGIL